MSKPRQRSPRPTSRSAKSNGKATSSPAAASQAPVPRPALDDRDAWKAYWAAQGQVWRTEPEIDPKRQVELAQHRAIVPDVEKGIYSFKEMKLSRADVEWLLATHENGRGPVDWNDESQRDREGLDLRGADLRHVNLSHLPLAKLHGGPTEADREDPRNFVVVYLEQADLRGAHLEGASLRRVHLEEASLSGASLVNADLTSAHLDHARIRWADLEGAKLRWTHLDYAHLRGSKLKGADLTSAYLQKAHLQEVLLCDEKYICPRVVDVHWEDVNLAVVNWTQVTMLGDEYEALQKSMYGKRKSPERRLEEYERAVRANRQLAHALQAQGLDEMAVRFTYRAQILQKSIFRFQMMNANAKSKHRTRSLRAWLFSWFLFLIAGYGYRPSRSFLAYFLVISGFATVYYLLGHTVGPSLSPLGAFVFSMTSFHGRGFFPGNNISLDDPLTVLAALEALVGLIIEVTFIATLTQRFFNR